MWRQLWKEEDPAIKANVRGIVVTFFKKITEFQFLKYQCVREETLLLPYLAYLVPFLLVQQKLLLKGS